MKKVVWMVCCLLMTAPVLFADTQRHKPQPAPAPAVSRSTQDPTVLTLLGKEYMLFKSQQDSLGENFTGWFNVYTLDGEESEEPAISIIKVANTKNEDLFAEEDEDDYITLDIRNPQDILGSQVSNMGSYTVVRAVQVGSDVFLLLVTVPEEESQTPQAQKELFNAVRNTPVAVLTEDFVQSVCKFGSDCRM